MTQSKACKPPLKWVGGKTQLLSKILPLIPPCNRYFEPFLGGGAVFFALQHGQSFLLDSNGDLITTYKVIRDRVEELIEDLKRHVYNKDYYYQIRNCGLGRAEARSDRTEEYQDWSDVQKASRFIYLNKTCFNGLYRVNSKGQFNVPMGDYKNPKILDEENLRACSKKMQNADIRHGSFLDIEPLLTENDFIYFDPPYVPLTATANFTGYTKGGFDLSQQIALRDLCDRVTKKGIKFVLSNSHTPLVLDLYKEYDIEIVSATRSLNSKSDERGKINEVLIKN